MGKELDLKISESGTIGIQATDPGGGGVVACCGGWSCSND